jgi:hypothetical protein
MNKTNLKLLADWLILNNDRLEEEHSFHMDHYRGYHDAHGGGVTPLLSSSSSCGTVGCALGWGPNTGIPALVPLHLGKGFDWSIYSGDIFDLCEGEYDWDWCFSGDWSNFDNTPKGAGIRILYLLDGLVTDNWDEGYGGYEAVVSGYTEWYDNLIKEAVHNGNITL